MRLRIKRLRERLLSSYWFWPVLLMTSAAALAVVMGYVDHAFDPPDVPLIGLAGAAGPDEARAILSTIAASAITVAGLVLSITIVVLSTTANQYGPRLLRNFRRHGGTQVVTGVFMGTFVYCLLALSNVSDRAIPTASVAAGLLLGVLSFGALIYFIGRVALLIQAPHVINDVGNDLEQVVRALPERDEPDGPQLASSLPRGLEETREVTSRKTGYIQTLDFEQIAEAARASDVLVVLRVRPGHHVIEGHAVAEVAPAARADDELLATLREAVVVGIERTATQDLEHPVRQLVEVAVRALSPGVNDPFTAMQCVDRLAASLSLLATRSLPPAIYRGEAGRVRVITRAYTYAGVVDAAFDPIRQSARTSVPVTLRLLETAATIAERDLPGSLRSALVRQVEAIRDGAREAFLYAQDLEVLEERAAAALERLRGPEDVQRAA